MAPSKKKKTVTKAPKLGGKRKERDEDEVVETKVEGEKTEEKNDQKTETNADNNNNDNNNNNNGGDKEEKKVEKKTKRRAKARTSTNRRKKTETKKGGEGEGGGDEKKKEKKEKSQRAKSPPRKKTKYYEIVSEDEEDELWDDWKEIYLVGTEWEIYDQVYKTQWDFDHLYESIEKFSESKHYHYIFGATEGHDLPDPEHPGQNKVTLVPTIIVVESAVYPPKEVAITSVMRGEGDRRSLFSMKMDWTPYFLAAQENAKKTRSEKVSSKILFLTCKQRKQGIRRMVSARDKKDDDKDLLRLKEYEYAIPYIWIPKNDENEEPETSVNIVGTCDGVGVTFEYDWTMDDVDDMTEEVLKANGLDEKHKETIAGLIKEKVTAAKKVIREAKEERKKRLEAMKKEEIDALNSLVIYKFYPQNKDFSIDKTSFINRYYGKANKVFPEIEQHDDFSAQFQAALPEYQNAKIIADDLNN